MKISKENLEKHIEELKEVIKVGLTFGSAILYYLTIVKGISDNWLKVSTLVVVIALIVGMFSLLSIAGFWVSLNKIKLLKRIHLGIVLHLMITLISLILIAISIGLIISFPS